MSGLSQPSPPIPRGPASQRTAIAPASEPPRLARLELVDVARGGALVAMAVYHFSWDLSFFQLIATDVGTDPAWKWFARGIAGAFLFLVGLSLVLGHADGIRWRPYLKRLALVTAAAGAITVATLFAFPDSYIFFGILHCIALSSVLALPFLRAPLPAVLAGAMIVLGAPRLFASESFNAPLLAWLGLGTRAPITNDYVPILPWFGVVLAGVAAGRALVPWIKRSPMARWRPERRVFKGLAFAGRHSLLVYLLHQPVLLAMLYPVAQMAGPRAAVQEARFRQSCLAVGRDDAACRRTWSCMEAELRRQDLWTRALRDTLNADERRAVLLVSRGCFAAP